MRRAAACYFSSHFSAGKLVAKLYGALRQDEFVASQESLGLAGFPSSEVEEFLKFAGVRSSPREVVVSDSSIGYSEYRSWPEGCGASGRSPTEAMRDAAVCCEADMGAPYVLAWCRGHEFLLRELNDDEAFRLQELCLACQANQADEAIQRVRETPVNVQGGLF